MPRPYRRLRVSALALIAGATALTVGCGSGLGTPSDASSTDRPVTTGEQQRGEQQRATGVRLARVASGLGDALYVTAAPGERGRLYVVRQGGTVVVLNGGKRSGRPFLDVSRLISSGGERGLLGLAFHPKYAANGRFYVNYTDRDGDTRVVEYRRRSPARANPSSARVLLTVRQPYSNHNGGHLAFGPDGYLYIAMGDGGSGGDPEGNGQRLDTSLGKLLRIDVDRRTGGRAYGIPADNPYRAAGQVPEIYSYGLRNPWRFSFDRARGDLWIGDVGQNEIEEINHRPKGAGRGANFGWNAFEGRARFAGGGPVRGRRPVAPVAQYTHASGCSVTGGYVFRGAGVPALRGRYVYADFCSGRVWSTRAGPRPGAVREITGRLGRSLSNVTSFGEGSRGELYLIASGTLYRFVGG